MLLIRVSSRLSFVMRKRVTLSWRFLHDCEPPNVGQGVKEEGWFSASFQKAQTNLYNRSSCNLVFFSTIDSTRWKSRFSSSVLDTLWSRSRDAAKRLTPPQTTEIRHSNKNESFATNGSATTPPAHFVTHIHTHYTNITMKLARLTLHCLETQWFLRA